MPLTSSFLFGSVKTVCSAHSLAKQAKEAASKAAMGLAAAAAVAMVSFACEECSRPFRNPVNPELFLCF